MGLLGMVMIALVALGIVVAFVLVDRADEEGAGEMLLGSWQEAPAARTDGGAAQENEGTAR